MNLMRLLRWYLSCSLRTILMTPTWLFAPEKLLSHSIHLSCFSSLEPHVSNNTTYASSFASSTLDASDVAPARREPRNPCTPAAFIASLKNSSPNRRACPTYRLLRIISRQTASLSKAVLFAIAPKSRPSRSRSTARHLLINASPNLRARRPSSSSPAIPGDADGTFANLTQTSANMGVYLGSSAARSAMALMAPSSRESETPIRVRER
mmetsp:Transcript_21598/g.43652  ORF Transcript_21598/g.43652 Transcript_21598/m.43652 type:complete len:209 (-) Transcript_21598:137-763(-)